MWSIVVYVGESYVLIYVPERSIAGEKALPKQFVFLKDFKELEGMSGKSETEGGKAIPRACF